MLRPVFCCCLALAGFALVPLARAGAPSDLATVTVDLPDSDRTFPDGPGAEAINNNCLACPSAGMVLNQPAMPRAAWAADDNKLINAYKAPARPEEAATTVDQHHK